MSGGLSSEVMDNIVETMREIKDTLKEVSNNITDIKIEQGKHSYKHDATGEAISNLKEQVNYIAKDIIEKTNKVYDKSKQDLHNEIEPLKEQHKAFEKKLTATDEKISKQNTFIAKIIVIAGGSGALLFAFVKELPLLLQKIIN